MMIYEKLFNEYSQLTAQVLLTKESITNKECRKNARQTFDELLRMNVVPIVNENDAISVDELAYGNFEITTHLQQMYRNLLMQIY